MQIERKCDDCGKTFVAKTKRGRFCTAACRVRASRRPGKQGTAAAPATDAKTEPKPSTEPSALVISVTKELQDASVLDTFPGQLALQLARRLSSPEESGVSALSKELRTVMAAALEGRTPPPADGEVAAPADGEVAAPAEEEDEVTRARKAREAKAREAAGRA